MGCQESAIAQPPVTRRHEELFDIQKLVFSKTESPSEPLAGTGID
jgi:hypothetical protein